MMSKLEYGDLYKFLASLGLTIVGMSYLIAWLFLKEPFSWLNNISSKEVNLNETTIEILKLKEEILLWFIELLKPLFIFMNILGFFVLIAGIIFWFRSQMEIDKNLKLKNDQLIKDMSAEEIIENKEKEINEDENQTNTFSSVKNYFNIENIIYNSITNLLRKKWIILKNKKIGNLEYDIILQSRNIKHSDIIIEIKYYKNPNTLKHALDKIIMSNQIYSSVTQRTSIPVVIIITPDKSKLSKDNKNRLQTFENRYNLKYVIMNEEELNDPKAKNKILNNLLK